MALGSHWSEQSKPRPLGALCWESGHGCSEDSFQTSEPRGWNRGVTGVSGIRISSSSDRLKSGSASNPLLLEEDSTSHPGMLGEACSP